MKNHKIAKNSTTTKDREEISTGLESKNVLMYVWLNLKTIKYYFLKLATDFYWQPSYSLGERASLHPSKVYKTAQGKENFKV